MKNSKNFLFVILMLLFLVIVGVFVFKNKSQKNLTKKTYIAATIFPIADIASNIAGDKFEVLTIIPPGVSPHTFTLKPSTVKKLQNSQMIFSVGLGFDNWVSGLIDSVPKMNNYPLWKGVDLHHLVEHDLDSEHHHGQDDPHYWLSPVNAKIIAANVMNVLSEKYPNSAKYFYKNYENYSKSIDQKYAELKNKISKLNNVKLFVFHNSWNYFAKAFSVPIAGVITLSPGKESSPGQIKQIYDKIKQEQSQVIFAEPQFSKDSLKSYAHDLSVDISILDPLGGVNGRDSYLGLIEYNVDQIVEAFNK